MRYTTLENIKQRLVGRLGVNSTPTLGSNVLGTQQVSNDLISTIADQIDETIDSYLQMIYELPLLNNHPILAGIAEKLIVSELMSVYYEGNSTGLTGDPGFGSIIRKQALDTLQSLFMGTGVLVLGAEAVPTNGQDTNQLAARFIPLRGEKLKNMIGIDPNNEGTPINELWASTPTDVTYYRGDKSEFERGINRKDRSQSVIDFYYN